MRRDFLSGVEVSNEKDASQWEGRFPVTRKLSSEKEAIQWVGSFSESRKLPRDYRVGSFPLRINESCGKPSCPENWQPDITVLLLFHQNMHFKCPAQKAILIPWQLIMTQWQWRNSRPSRPCSARWHQNYYSANVDKKFFDNLKININTKIIHTCNLTPSSKGTLCNFIAPNILELRRGRKMVLGAQMGANRGRPSPTLRHCTAVEQDQL